jgi:hypothetical protein
LRDSSGAPSGRLGPLVASLLLALAAAVVLALAPAPPPASAAGAGAAFTSPAAGATGVTASDAFTWGKVAAAQGYYVTIGTTVGAYDVVASGELPATQTSYVSPLALPTGRPLYARLYTKLAGSYSAYQDLTFTAAPAGSKALFTSPLDGQASFDAGDPFTWSTVAGAQSYYLTIGTSAGAYDVLASGELPATQSSYTSPVALPTGRTLYARIYTKVNGAYDRYQDVSFTATTGGKALLLSPTDGQPGIPISQTFSWSTVAAAQGYYLTLGTSAGAYDVLASGELPATQSTYKPPIALPAGRKLYARIYTKVDGAYGRYQDIAFTVVSSQLPALTVSANQILAKGQPFHFYGVNRDSLEWGASNWTGCAGDGHFTDTDFDNIKAWHATAVRIPLSQANWLGRRCDPAAYLRSVDGAIAKANARGMYAILDLHWSDVQGRAPCDSGCTTGQQPMPDADSVTFWQQVAARYADRPGVVFDLYNEPHDVSWSCWRNGGCSVLSSPSTNGGTQVAYTAVGMQQLTDAIRGQGAHNLVLAAGLDWAYDLSGVGAGYALSGENIAYDTHVYVRSHDTVADWDQHVGFLTATRPVTSTEFGSIDCSSAVTSQLLDYFRSKGIGWTIWGWNAPGSCAQPSVLADMNGTPLAGQGQLIHDRLAALAG